MNCYDENVTSDNKQYETVLIEKTKNVCPMCEDYSKKHSSKQVAVLSCEGACLRGEISRQAANKICFDFAADKTVRICLGGAFTKDSGQRDLVKNAQKVIAIEGCFINCASRMMKGVIPELKPDIVIADKLYDFDKKLFEINEMTSEEISIHAETVASKVFAMFQNNISTC